MQFATRRVDYVPTVREGTLIPDHVDGGVITIILPLIELIKEALVVLAGGLIGVSYGAEAHYLKRVDEALILQGLPPSTTSAGG
jgi:hypothetical protein